MIGRERVVARAFDDGEVGILLGEDRPLEQPLTVVSKQEGLLVGFTDVERRELQSIGREPADRRVKRARGERDRQATARSGRHLAAVHRFPQRREGHGDLVLLGGEELVVTAAGRKDETRVGARERDAAAKDTSAEVSDAEAPRLGLTHLDRIEVDRSRRDEASRWEVAAPEQIDRAAAGAERQRATVLSRRDRCVADAHHATDAGLEREGPRPLDHGEGGIVASIRDAADERSGAGVADLEAQDSGVADRHEAEVESIVVDRTARGRG